MPAIIRAFAVASALCLSTLSLPVLAVAGPAAATGGASVTLASHHDRSRPLRRLVGSPTHSRIYPARGGRQATKQTARPAAATTSAAAATAAAPATAANFDGIGANGSAPSDSNGAAGANQYVELVNSQIAVYSKSGTPLLAPVNTNTLWAGFGGDCQTHNDGDGTVQYDQAAGRWFIQQFTIDDTNSAYNECIAVSTSPDATGTWNRYAFPFANFPDYPKTGVWSDAYYASFNLFTPGGGSAVGARMCAFDRARMLTGLPATMQCFMATPGGENTFIPASIDGATPPPAGTPEWFVGLSPGTADALAYAKFHVDWTTPANSSLSGLADLPVAPFTIPCNGGGVCIPQAGTGQRLDSIGDRVMFRLAYRNYGDHESLVINHSVVAGSSVGIRWYELRPSGSALGVFQEGTYAPDSSYRWVGSLAMDGSGNMALGFSISSASLHPGIRYTGRLAADPLGTMSLGEASIIAGAGSQTGSGLSRWGDYSEMSIDPVDDCTFWYVNQYEPHTGGFNWATRIASFKFPGCGATVNDNFSLAATPGAVSATQGNAATSNITTAVTSGAAQPILLSAAGLPAGAAASFSPQSLSAGATSVLRITTSSSTPAGVYPLVVTGAGSRATHAAALTLVVSSPRPRMPTWGPGRGRLAQLRGPI